MSLKGQCIGFGPADQGTAKQYILLRGHWRPSSLSSFPLPRPSPPPPPPRRPPCHHSEVKFLEIFPI
ncbi:hypothetical protein I7I50_00033 [Histoplasma capsulatum G186AR]|uniref:Uncharacterized protein n=1 Tax=Ajellomyces capsulatus TaxID=5037 RepID=A0A8H8CUL5_AJECA|nr:hypothetical protein I7I52_07302 [Histoplasma capsulatum]QSS72241.1 hypothetical protein I7I50_00033 [Histoplasma capsulatum G186AR]